MTRNLFFKRILMWAVLSMAPLFKIFGITPATLYRHEGLVPLSPDDPLKHLYARLEYTYGGYGLFWTGWKESQYSVDLAGQWAAWPLIEYPEYGYYASYPGGEGKFCKGQSFDPCIKNGQDCIGWIGSDSEEVREAAKVDALRRLLVLLDEDPL